MTHTTDSEMKAAFEGCCYLMPIQTLFQEMGCNVHDPILLFCDNKAVVDIIDRKRMTMRCRHIDIPIAFLHVNKGNIYRQQLIPTDQMIADLGTKPNSPAVHKRFKYWGTGVMFLPSKHHIHYEYLQLKYYEIAFCEILNMLRKQGSSQSSHNNNSQDGG